MTNIELIKSMFKSTQEFDFEYSMNVSVEIDDFLTNPDSVFAGNAFNTREDFIKYISDIRKLGATNIRVTGFPVKHGWSNDDIIKEPYGDTLVFNAPNESYNKIKKVLYVDETDNYQLENYLYAGDFKNNIRFWWD